MATDTLDRIAKLLAHAEACTTPEEAEAYVEKAAHIAAVAAINLELAYAHQAKKEEREEPTVKRVTTGVAGKKFANMRGVDLFGAVAEANDLRYTIAHDRSACWAYGYPSDISVTELLYGSLVTQVRQLGDAALRRGDHKALGVHGATFRINFECGFAREIETRLLRARREARQEQKARDEEISERLVAAAGPVETTASAPAITGELVMIQKKEAVNDYYAATTAGKLSRRSYSGYQPGRVHYGADAAGRAAAKTARLGTEKALPGGPKAVR